MCSKSYSVKLLNKTYEIKCPDEEVENLQASAKILNEQLVLNKKKFPQLGEFERLLLAAISVSHQLLHCQKQQEQQRKQVNQFISSLENKISQVVTGHAAEMDPQTD